MKTTKILVVDDDPQLRRVMKAALTKQGYIIGDVRSGEAALQRLRAERYDLVILDRNMPEWAESKPAVRFGSIQTLGSSCSRSERPNWTRSKLWTQARMTTSQSRLVCPTPRASSRKPAVVPPIAAPRSEFMTFGDVQLVWIVITYRFTAVTCA